MKMLPIMMRKVYVEVIGDVEENDEGG